MHEILLSGYFREELQQRIWGRGSVLGRPQRVLLGYRVSPRQDPKEESFCELLGRGAWDGLKEVWLGHSEWLVR